jgi:serine/threonine-protein kinase
VVADFGVAKALSASTNPGSSLTSLGVALGTPAYMAPEQAAADPSTDYRADLYAVGAMAYEMLTGHQVFSARSPQAMLAAHAIETPEPIDKRRPSVPRELSSLIMRSLEKRAADRPQSAVEMLAGLEAAVTPSGASAPNFPEIQRRRGPGRRAAIAGAIAGIAAAIVAVTLFATRAQATGRIDTIGVMPIEDISGRDSIFVAAMHDAVTIALSRPGNVGVVPRSAMMRYKGSSKTTREIAKENRLDAVVEATVFRAGDVMRINVQLTDPLTSRGLWSDTYERNVNNVLAAQTEVAEKIALGVAATIKAPLR